MTCPRCERHPCVCVVVRALATGEVLRVEQSVRAFEADKRHAKSRRHPEDGMLSVSEYAKASGYTVHQLKADPQAFGAVKGQRGHWRYPKPQERVQQRPKRVTAGVPHRCATDLHPSPSRNCYRHGCRCAGCTTAHAEGKRVEAADRRAS